MYDQPLYVEMTQNLRDGEYLTVRDAVERFGRSEGHTRRVMQWMASAQEVPKLDLIPDTRPMRWRRNGLK